MECASDSRDWLHRHNKGSAAKMSGIAGIARITPAGEASRLLSLVTPGEAIPERWLDVLDDSLKPPGGNGGGRFRDRVVRGDGCVVDVALLQGCPNVGGTGGAATPVLSLAKGHGIVRECEYSFGGGLGVYAGRPNQRATVDRSTGRNTSSCEREARGDAPASRMAAVMDGRLYDQMEVCRELTEQGHVFGTADDPVETLLHHVRERGIRGLVGSESGYAAAVWEAASASLMLTSDWLGERPLYSFQEPASSNAPQPGTPLFAKYHDFGIFPIQAYTLAFCSTVEGLARLRAVMGHEVRVWACSNWVDHGYFERPLVDGVENVRSNVVTFPVSGGWSETRRYGSKWQVRPWENRDPGTPVTAAEIDRLVADAVRRRAGDVDACLLSGADSALLASHVRRCNGRVRTVHVRLAAVGDESEDAARWSEAIGSAHDTVDEPVDPATDLVRMIEELGEPLGDPNSLRWYWITRGAARATGITMSAAGSDVLFGGRESCIAIDQLKERGNRRVNFQERASRWYRPGSWFQDRGGRTLQTTGETVDEVFPFDEHQQLIAREHEDGTFMLDGPGSFTSGATSQIERDLARYLPDMLLRTLSSVSGRFGVEIRLPFLDDRLMNAACFAPIENLLPGLRSKGLLRDVERLHFPAELVDRPRVASDLPVGTWFRTNFGGMRDLLHDSLNSKEPFGPDSLGINRRMNMKYVRQMMQEHDAGTEGAGNDHSRRLYVLLVLSIWARVFVGWTT